MKIQLPGLKNRYSLFSMFALILIIAGFRILTLIDNELSWDVLGYYIHLPAMFIYKDYGLSDINWIHRLLELYPLTGSLYQISTGPEGNPIFFFLMGVSLFYLPWFLIAHLLATFSGYTADGFSLPYQYTLAIGAITYTILGLVYLRKILLNFFTDRITTIVMIILVLGTNYLHFMTVKNLETANILFLMVTLITWNTIQWHKHFKIKNLLAIAVFIVLTALAKPSEVLVLLIPFFWGVFNRETFRQKLRLIGKYRNQFISAIIAGLIVALPQMIYWYSETGYILYDSYKNPGVGLDLATPHIVNVLFSFKKGWFIYTPVMIFSVIGFVQLYRKDKGVFVPVLAYSLVAFYILSSWTEWWYGASYSIRPMITLYPLLAITLGSFIEMVSKKRILVKTLFAVFTVFFIVLNLFQTWQLNHYILDPYRTNKAYYFAIFGKTKINDKTRQLLSTDLTFNDGARMTNENDFNKRNIGFYDFEEVDVNYADYYISDSIKGTTLKMDSTLGFSPEIRTIYRALTKKEYVWFRASVDVFIPFGYKDELPLLVMTFDRKEGAYYYHSYAPDTNIYKPGTWGKIKVDLMTPNIRSRNDAFKTYVWNRGKTPILIDNLKVDVYEPK